MYVSIMAIRPQMNFKHLLTRPPPPLPHPTLNGSNPCAGRRQRPRGVHIKSFYWGSTTPVILSPLSLAPQEHKSHPVSGISHGGASIPQLVLRLGNQKDTRALQMLHKAPRRPACWETAKEAHSALSFIMVPDWQKPLGHYRYKPQTTDCMCHPNKYKLWSKRSGRTTANCRKCSTTCLHYVVRFLDKCFSHS